MLVALARVAGAPGLRALGLVHRDVGVLHQLLVVAGVLGEQRDADARGDAQVQALDRERLRDRAEDLVGDHLGLRDVAQAAEQHAELVAAEPRRGVAGAQHRVQALADLAQQLVAGVVAERVVELLEVVEVEQQQRHARVARLAGEDRVAQAAQEVAAVGHRGELVGERLPTRFGERAHVAESQPVRANAASIVASASASASGSSRLKWS